jgi:FSR family fosmidomycin resistance protein-like MFS transporter
MEKSFIADSSGAAAAASISAPRTRFNILGAITFSHFLNDMMQSLIVAIYPLPKGEFNLSFAQIGVIECGASP